MKLINSIILTLLLALPVIGFSADSININTADKEMLMSVIKGVGEKKAEAIIEYRKANGDFKSVDELTNVKGIGQSTVDKHRDMLTTSE
ncbi:MAG: ComEA family DNA-binding protein [Proteobacteria bacterium]|nr:ComEA family DNA-binding protein [Pseudomonadota bacterium]